MKPTRWPWTRLHCSTLLEALKSADADDRARSATESLCQALIDAELTAAIGAAPLQFTDTRTAQRNGSRPLTLTTTVGDLAFTGFPVTHWKKRPGRPTRSSGSTR